LHRSGEMMRKFITHMAYSTGSWARMIHHPGDRHAALEHIIEALGGSLLSLYWQVGTQDSLCISELPDSVTAGALNTVITKSGAFKAVDTYELLTQKQLVDVLALARDVEDVFEVPGVQG
jgi:uncharacterized protein with GYD domain